MFKSLQGLMGGVDELLYGSYFDCVVESLLCASNDCGLIFVRCSVCAVVMMSMQPESHIYVSLLV